MGWNTHEVSNQFDELQDYNLYTTDAALQDQLRATIGGNQSGPVTASLRSALVSIQRGDAADPHGWVHRIG